VEIQLSELLLEIAHCPNILACFHDRTRSHPCRRIIESQKSPSADVHQVPEPWSGKLSEAPLLFVSSNPSISETDHYPLPSWGDEEVKAYFGDRFEKWITDGRYTRQQDGSYSRAVPFWNEVRGRATELYERTVKPGKDYALTEVVHCKSRNNKGVEAALTECVDRYLPRVLSCSNATVIVALGKFVKQILTDTLGIPRDTRVYGPTEVSGKIRHIVFLAQPNSNQPRRFSAVVSAEELAELRSALKKAP
jgi:uracil-DNA glycosylase